MKVKIRGHIYELDTYDQIHDRPPETIVFMKRIGGHYPGNLGQPHAGTNCQEVIRVLIDRVKYLDNQIPCQENKDILEYLRLTLLRFEQRAAKIHGRKLRTNSDAIENERACFTCGHLECQIKEHNNELCSVPEVSEGNKSLP